MEQPSLPPFSKPQVSQHIHNIDIYVKNVENKYKILCFESIECTNLNQLNKKFKLYISVESVKKFYTISPI